MAGRSPDQWRWAQEALQQLVREMRITAWAALEGSVWVNIAVMYISKCAYVFHMAGSFREVSV